MTHESTIAKAVALQFESKLDALRKNQDGTVKLTLTINPTDFPMQLMADPMGQRYVTVMVAVNDDETPKIPQIKPSEKTPEKWADMPCVKKAGILCGDDDFNEYTLNDPKGYIYRTCSVTSRKDIDGDPEAVRAFNQLVSGFRTWQQEKQRGRI